ncbi:MAG: 2-hydroxyacid dehydrogenase [Bacteroidales bacterium]
MARIAFFSTKPHDRQFFENQSGNHQFEFFETRLKSNTVQLAKGFDGVCVFVNDRVNADVLKSLSEINVRLVALRCAGFNNVDLEAAEKYQVRVMRVPAYSPEAVAEHAIALIMTMARKTHKAYVRVREGNFSLERLTGFNINGKTIGVIGTGKIGQAFIRIVHGFGAKVIAYDKYPNDEMKKLGVNYLDFEDVLSQSDILSLHCPLTPETHHLINADTLKTMKQGAMLVNTSRGKLVDTASVIESLKEDHLGSLAIDVYEQEEKLFFRDLSELIIRDDQIARLMLFPNVLITSHQGFFTKESLEEITRITLQNIEDYEAGRESENEVSCKLLKDCK